MPIIPPSLRPSSSVGTLRQMRARPVATQQEQQSSISSAQRQELVNRLQQLMQDREALEARKVPGLPKAVRREIQALGQYLSGQMKMIEQAIQTTEAGGSFQNLEDVYSSAQRYGQQLKSAEMKRFKQTRPSPVPKGGYAESTGSYSKIYDEAGNLVQVIQRDDSPLPDEVQQEILTAQIRQQTIQPETLSPQPSSSTIAPTKVPLYYELGESGQPVDNVVFTSPGKEERVSIISRPAQEEYGPIEPLYQDIDTLDIQPGQQPFRVPEVSSPFGFETYSSETGLFTRPSEASWKATPMYRTPTRTEREAFEQYPEFETAESTLQYGIKSYKENVVEPLSESKVFNFYKENVVEPLSESKVFGWYEDNVVLPARENFIKELKNWRSTAESFSPWVSKVPIVKQIQQVAQAKMYMDRLADESPGTKVKMFIGGEYKLVDPIEYRNMGLFEFTTSLYGKQVGAVFEKVANEQKEEGSYGAKPLYTPEAIGKTAELTATIGPYFLPGVFVGSTALKISEAQVGGGIFGGPTSAREYVKENPLEVAFVGASLYSKAVSGIRKTAYGLTDAEKIIKYEKFLGREVEEAKMMARDIMGKKSNLKPVYKSFKREYINPQTGQKEIAFGLKLKGYTGVGEDLPTGEILGFYTERTLPTKKGLFGNLRYDKYSISTGDIFIADSGAIVKTLKYPTGELKIITVKNGIETIEVIGKNGKVLVKVSRQIDDATKAVLESIKRIPEKKIVIDPENIGDRYIITRSRVLLDGQRKEVLIIEDVITKEKFSLLSSDPLAKKYLGRKIPDTQSKKLFGEFKYKQEAFQTKDKTSFLEVRSQEGFSDVIVSGEKKGTLGFRRTVFGQEKPTTAQVTSKIRATPKILYGKERGGDTLKTIYGVGEYSKVQVVAPLIKRKIERAAGSEYFFGYVNPKSKNYKNILERMAKERKTVKRMVKEMRRDREYYADLYRLEEEAKLFSEKQSEKILAAAERRAAIRNFFKIKEKIVPDPGLGFPTYVGGSGYAPGRGYTQMLDYTPQTKFFDIGLESTSRAAERPIQRLRAEIIKPLIVERPETFLSPLKSATKNIQEGAIVSLPVAIPEKLNLGNILAPVVFLSQDKILKQQLEPKAKIEEEQLIFNVFQQPQEIQTFKVRREQVSDQRVEQRQLQEQITRQQEQPRTDLGLNLLTGRTARPEEPFEPTKPRVPIFDWGFGESFKEEVTGYETEVFSRGRWKLASKKPMTKEGAIDLGARIVDNTTAAQWKVKPITKTFRNKDKAVVTKQVKFAKEKLEIGDGYYEQNRNKFREFKVFRGKKTPLEGQWIEKKTSRSDTPGEKSGLTFGQRRARSSKIAMGLPTRRSKSNTRQRFRL